MNKKKQIIVLSCIVALFASFVALGFFLTKDNVKGYIITSEIASFYCENLNCRAINNSVFKEKTESERLFQVYYKSEYLNEYIMDYKSRWNHFNKNGNWQNVPSDFIAFSPSLKAQIVQVNERKGTKEEEQSIEKVLKKEKYDHEYHQPELTVYEFDLNQNGSLDQIIFATNKENSLDQYYFSLLLSNIDGKIETIAFTESTQNEALPSYQVYSAFQLNEAKNTGIIINKNYLSLVGQPSMTIYQVKKHKLEQIATKTQERNESK